MITTNPTAAAGTMDPQKRAARAQAMIRDVQLRLAYHEAVTLEMRDKVASLPELAETCDQKAILSALFRGIDTDADDISAILDELRELIADDEAA